LKDKLRNKDTRIHGVVNIVDKIGIAKIDEIAGMDMQRELVTNASHTRECKISKAEGSQRKK